MVDPVILQQGKQVFQQGVDRVMNSGGGFVKGVLTSPLNALSGGAIGVKDWVLSTGTLMWGAGATLLATFAPDLIPGVTSLLGRPEWGAKLAAAVQTGGWPALLPYTFGAAAVSRAAIGAVKGTIGGVTGGFDNAAETPEQSSGMGLGAVVGSVVAIGAIGAVAIGALKKDGISHDAAAGDKVEPPKVPGKPGASTQKT